MGRYWDMNNGAEGKFGVGMQSSDDAKIFGAEEDNYYLHMYSDNLSEVTEKLRELFKVIEEPFNEDLYKGSKDEVGERIVELWQRVDKRFNLPNYAWSSNETEEENERIGKYFMVMLRIRIGLNMANCIYENGFCSMRCEQ